jgi:hypothetical protein
MYHPSDVAVFAERPEQAVNTLRWLKGTLDHTGKANCKAFSWGGAVIGQRFKLVLAFIPEDPSFQHGRYCMLDYFNTTIRCAVAPGGTLLRFPDWPCWLDKAAAEVLQSSS